MPPPLQSANAFTRKGKLFFIHSMEKVQHLSALLAEIEFVFKNPQTLEVVLYFKALALALPVQAFRTISWREGTNKPLSGRFAAVRVRHAGGNAGKARLRPLQWLLIEWPADQAEPVKYVLSTMPEDTPLNELVGAAHQRWRIERDYQDLKQDFGLGHYEGRGWRGLHHHATLSIAAYGFLMAERLIADKPVGGKKNFIPTSALF